MFALLVALQIVTVPDEAAQATAESAEVLSAFKEVCWAIPDLQLVGQLAAAKGWQRLQAGKYSPADRLKAAIESDAKASYRVHVQQFERRVGDRTLLLTVDRGELTMPTAKGFGGTNCAVNEVSEARPLDVSTVHNWLGRSPDEVWQTQDGVLGHEWHSIQSPDPTIVQVIYVPPGSALAGEEGLSGINLSAQAHGENKR